jgi:hypothetical protein
MAEEKERSVLPPARERRGKERRKVAERRGEKRDSAVMPGLGTREGM